MSPAPAVSFAAPGWLALLVLVPLLAVAYVLLQRRRDRYAVRFTNLDLLANLAPARPRWRRHVPPALYTVAALALVVALARPETTVDVPRRGGTVVLVTDTSGSMQATDVQPDRLTAAKVAGRGFLEDLQPLIQVGLVSFSEQARVVIPPTADRAAVRGGLDSLDARGGTAMGDGLDLALQAARDLPEGSASILLLSDGASTSGSREPLDVGEDLAREQIPVFAVALGTDSGTVTVQDQLGTPQTVPVPPDRETLRQLAERTGGQAYDALTDEQLQDIYDRIGTRVGTRQEQREVTWAFAAGGLGFLLAGGVLAALWFNRFP